MRTSAERGLDILSVNPSVTTPPELRRDTVLRIGSYSNCRTRTTLFVKRDSVMPLVRDMGPSGATEINEVLGGV